MGAYHIKTPPQHAEWSDILDIWRAADEMEVFEAAWNFDHFYPLHPPMDGPCLEAWTTLAALAQATSRLRIGTMVNGMHNRHPAVTANMAATLDIISEGRLELGLGAGWFEAEADAYGIELGSMRERMDRFDEGVEVVISLLSNETTDYSGTHYRLRGARCEPKGPQRPHPPIAIGGKGRTRTLRTVARYANLWDTVRPGTTAEWLELDEVLAGHCEAVGRDPAEIRRSIHVMWEPDEDPARLVEDAQSFFEVGVDVVVFSMRSPYRASQLEPLARAIAG